MPLELKEGIDMSLWDRIDAESKGPLEGLWQVLPGGLNGIADIVARLQAMSAFRDAAPVSCGASFGSGVRLPW